MKLVSWNLNGIRAVAKKGLKECLEEIDADVICFQETKAQNDQVAEVVADYGYHLYSNHAVKKGYSGVAALCTEEPISVTNDLGIEEHDQEGRVQTLEFEKFYLVNTYVPNSKNGLTRLDYRETWDAALLAHMVELEKKKPVILCGDLNVAHTAMDIKNDKSNFNKSPGYTEREIAGLDNMIAAGYKDSYRVLNPDTVKYSWWSYRFNSRANNTGWRIDYFMVSDKLMGEVKDAFIMNDIFGSDHCPVGIDLNSEL